MRRKISARRTSRAGERRSLLISGAGGARDPLFTVSRIFCRRRAGEDFLMKIAGEFTMMAGRGRGETGKKNYIVK